MTLQFREVETGSASHPPAAGLRTKLGTASTSLTLTVGDLLL